MATLDAVRDSQERMLTEMQNIKNRTEIMQRNMSKMQTEVERLKNPMLTDLEKAQAMYAESLTQGGVFWIRNSFKINGDGTASLMGRGTAVLNSGTMSNNAGNGAVLYMTFTNLEDPLFKQCRSAIETGVFSPSEPLVVYGLGSFMHGKADPEHPENITSAYAYRISTLTKCEIVKSKTLQPGPAVTSPSP